MLLFHHNGIYVIIIHTHYEVQKLLKLEDMVPGMELQGTVRNVVDFGAFIDCGIKEAGLVHISKMSKKYIKHPLEVVSVGDIVKVWVIAADLDRKRLQLTMLQPGTEFRS